jgi:hypothetical protein
MTLGFRDLDLKALSRYYLFFFAVFLALMPMALRGQEVVPSADYTGSRTTSTAGEINTTGTWSSGLKISWTISFSSSTKLWDYTYTVSKASGTTLNTTGSDFYLQAAAKSSVSEYHNTGSPAMNGPFYESYANETGLEFTSSSTGLFVVSFTSQFAPVWGDFYFTNGSATGTDTGYGTVSSTGSNILQYIAVPAGANIQVPELSTWMLLTCLLIPVVLIKRRTKQNHLDYS